MFTALEMVRKIYGRAKLPSGIEFQINNKTLLVTVEDPCINMQNDGASFESWIIVLKSHYNNDIENVILDFNESEILSETQQNHYNRFIWRIVNFKYMYLPWFSVAKSKQEIVNNFFRNNLKNAVINTPSKERTQVINSNGERRVEWLFANNDELHTKLGCCCILNQIPVGIFDNVVSKQTAIFSSGASAIDLLGVDNNNDILHLIELKKGNNYSLGIISELLFYTFILYNTLTLNIFGLDKGKLIGKFKNSLIKGKYSVDAHFLAEKYHPLLDDDTMRLLNEGLVSINVKVDKMLYKYVNQKVELL